MTTDTEALLHRANQATQMCGPCDGGLPMGCTCDPEPRAVIAGLLELLAARGKNSAHEADWDAITETIASDSAKSAGWEPNDYDSDDPVTWDLAFRLPAKRAVEIIRAALSPAADAGVSS